jgi:hypothetical protein
MILKIKIANICAVFWIPIHFMLIRRIRIRIQTQIRIQKLIECESYADPDLKHCLHEYQPFFLFFLSLCLGNDLTNSFCRHISLKKEPEVKTEFFFNFSP